MDDTFTEKQRRLIEYLKAGGYGWRKFATSVEAQGWCSQKQEDTMCNMHNQLSLQRSYATSARHKTANLRWDSFDSISDMYQGGYEGFGDNNAF